MPVHTLARAGFVVSVAVLAMGYGLAANQWGWVPSSVAQRAWNQAEALFTDNPFSYRVPRVYDRQGARTLRPDAVQPGVTLVSSLWKPADGWQPQVRLLDQDGAVLHTWTLDADLFAARSYVHGTHLLPDGDLVVNLEYVGTVRLGPCGTVRWRLPKRTHHAVTRADDGSFWIPAQIPGRATGPLGDAAMPEQLLRVSATGEVLRTIDLLPLLFENGLAAPLFRAHGPQPRGELLHVNDVEPLPASMADAYPRFDAGDLLVSLRDLHLVLVVDPDTEAVRWHAEAPFLRQHDPDFLGDGRIGVFDNRPDGTARGTLLGGSRIVVLHLPSDSTSVRFPTARSGPFYTEAGGTWQSLPNGNLLLGEAQAGRVVEVTADGAPVWEWVRAARGERVPQVLDATRHALSPAAVAEWPCGADE